jgi:chaperonin GroEL
MSKKITFDSAAHAKLKIGVDALADAVSVTLGPKGRNVILCKDYGSPAITKDGVSVAREVFLEDPMENAGAQLVKEVASKTAEAAGDGTTTATVLAQAIYAHGLKNVAAGANPMDLKRGIDKAVLLVTESLAKQSKKIKSSEQIRQVATISSNNDVEIGGLIAEGMKRVGMDGVITVEDSKGIESEITVVEGMRFDRGYLSPHFVTNTERMEVEMTNPYVLLTDKKIASMREMLPIIQQVADTGNHPLLFISPNVEGEALATLVVNKMRGALHVAAVKTPGFGDRVMTDALEDLAVITGGKVISEIIGLKIEECRLEHLGRAEKIIIDNQTTTIVKGAGKSIDVKERVAQVKHQIENSEIPYEKERLKERIAKLTGGVAILYVGASTEVELKEKKDRIDDALHATRAAVQEGVVPGGGVAYIRAIDSLKSVAVDNQDQETGVNIIRLALEAPLRVIAKNSGAEASVVVDKVRSLKKTFGYNARDDKYEEFFAAGIIDPTKVSRLALENAASIAGLLLTTDVIISEIPKDKPEANGPVAR